MGLDYTLSAGIKTKQAFTSGLERKDSTTGTDHNVVPMGVFTRIQFEVFPNVRLQLGTTRSDVVIDQKIDRPTVLTRLLTNQPTLLKKTETP